MANNLYFPNAGSANSPLLPVKPNSGTLLPFVKPSVPSSLKPTNTLTVAEKKEKLQTQLTSAEQKLKWLNNNLQRFDGYTGQGLISLPPYEQYKRTFYHIRVSGKNINEKFKYAEKRFRWFYNAPGYVLFSEETVHSIDNINKLKAEYAGEISSLKTRIAALSPTTKKQQKDSAPTPKNKEKNPKQGALIYNVAAVKEAYFTNERASLQLEGEGDGDPRSSANTTLMSAYGNKTQGGITDPYTQLWNRSTNHKGMIVAWPDLTGAGINERNASGGGAYKADNNRYGFQFHYNPQPITMSYAGAPAVDVVNFMTGQEEYALYTAGAGSGTIEFQLMLNRIEDMKYYDVNGTLTKNGVYPGRQPYGKKDTAQVKDLFNEQECIFNRGTMYDIEFLLRTVLGVTMKSKFRGTTADFGWIGAMPVEVHLGKGLRYHGNLSAFTINHVMFNERMVPIFSTVRMVINRLPDNMGKYTPGESTSSSPTTAPTKAPYLPGATTTTQSSNVLQRLVDLNKAK